MGSEHTPTHKQVAFTRLKRAIYKNVLQLRGFGEPDLEHLYKHASKKKSKDKNTKMSLHEAQ